MPDNSCTIVGNVTRAPELRFTASGQATASFGVAVNRKWMNRQTNEWQEQVSFFNVVCWQNLAENVAESLEKGARVVVTGRLEQRGYESNGEKKSIVELVADEIGPSLKWATAQVQRNERQDHGATGQRDTRPAANQQTAASPSSYDDDEPFALAVGLDDAVPQPLRYRLRCAP